MAPNDSRHHLPLQSVLFDSRILLTPSHLKTDYNPTLANLNEAQDTLITAIPPMPPLPNTTTADEQPSASTKKSVWRRVRSKVKKLFRRKKKDESMTIGLMVHICALLLSRHQVYLYWKQKIVPEFINKTAE